MSLQIQRMMASTVTLTAASLGALLFMFRLEVAADPIAALALGFVLCPVILLLDVILLPVSWTSGKEALSGAEHFLPALRPQPGERMAAQVFRIVGVLIALVYLTALVICIAQLNLTGALFCLLRMLHLVCLLSILLTAFR